MQLALRPTRRPAPEHPVHRRNTGLSSRGPTAEKADKTGHFYGSFSASIDVKNSRPAAARHRKVLAPPTRVEALAVSADGWHVVSGCSDGTVKVWETHRCLRPPLSCSRILSRMAGSESQADRLRDD